MLNETIKRARMYSGKTQATLAKALFISEATYSRKENGLMKFERQEALKIGKLLARFIVSFNILFGMKV